MRTSKFSAFGCVGLFWTLAAGASIPRYFEKQQITRRALTSAQVQKELASQLSNTTLVYGPQDSQFINVTSRWTDFSQPRVEVAIEPGLESDVAKIVQYCSTNSIEFLATSGGHGLTATLGTFEGILVSMRQLKTLEIQPSGESAWFGGGLIVGEVIDALWDEGYTATTGGCECVGMLGAGLGGGHGRQEGIYGLIADNLLELNVVLANGSEIRVNSTSHSDLLWGMKGAGHNFGIVTGYEMSIYPQGPDTWHYHNYVWLGDKLEAVFDALNVFHGNGTTPVDMAFEVGSFLMNTTITTEDPVLYWSFAYRGPAEEAEALLAPFNAIESAYEQSGDVPYSGVAAAQGTGMNDPICEHNNMHRTSTAFLQVYNVTTERLIYNGFKERVISQPDLVANANIMHEGYATKAVEEIDSADSAYPFRHERHLTLFDTIVPSPELEDAAAAWASEVVDLWNAGQPDRHVNAYVNYANGLETPEQHYGYEPWRLERLRNLKSQYDPDNRFRYYNPIVVS